jgi:hypothetical protein
MRNQAMIKLRGATGLGLLLFIATMIGGSVAVSPAQAKEGGDTLASLEGSFAGRGSGSSTICFNATFTAAADCATAPNVVPFNSTVVEQFTRDAAGNSCGVLIESIAPLVGTQFPASVNLRTDVGTSTFNPTTGVGNYTFSLYSGGTCTGADFDSTGADLAATGTSTFVVSDSGDRIEIIYTSISTVTDAAIGNVAGALQGFVLSQTAIRQKTR